MLIDVKLHLQILAIHENHRVFKPIILKYPKGSRGSVEQIWVSGTHGSIGWDNPKADHVLALIIQRLRDHTHLSFDELALSRRFRYYTTDTAPPSNVQIVKPWVDWMAFFGLGLKRRTPGCYGVCGMITNEWIHVSVRLRGHGRMENDPAVPGFVCESGDDGKFLWREVLTGFETRKKKDPLVTRWEMPEAPLGNLESKLLGLGA
jgi:hypothetical protein